MTAPLFETSAKEVIERLEGDVSPEAEALRVEALGLMAIFQSWTIERAHDQVRADVVNRLFSLYRRTLNHLLQK